MFGKRSARTNEAQSQRGASAEREVSLDVVEAPTPAEPPPPPVDEPSSEQDLKYNDTKQKVFSALVEAVDLTELGKLQSSQVREEITDIVGEIIALQSLVLSASEQTRLITDICNDVLGLGPLEPLIARDDIADIMVNGPKKVYIETEGKIELTSIRFRDEAQLMNICQRIVSAVGRRVDESSPICDARLLDGSRVNVIVPRHSRLTAPR